MIHEIENIDHQSSTEIINHCRRRETTFIVKNIPS